LKLCSYIYCAKRNKKKSMNPFVNCIVKKSILITTVLLAFLIFQSCKKDPFEANSGSFTDSGTDMFMNG
jgi:hypothetical protein